MPDVPRVPVEHKDGGVSFFPPRASSTYVEGGQHLVVGRGDHQLLKVFNLELGRSRHVFARIARDVRRVDQSSGAVLAVYGLGEGNAEGNTDFCLK